MRRISTIFVIFVFSTLGLVQSIETAVAGPSEDMAGLSAHSSGEPLIDRLAAASKSTVFSQTSYNSPSNSVQENGSWWFRDGYPYPGNQGGWGFSVDASIGAYHPGNCRWYENMESVCFRTGDANRNLSRQPIKVRQYCDLGYGPVAGGGGIAYTCWNLGYGIADDTCLRPNWCPIYWYKLVDSYTEVWQNGLDNFVEAGGTLGGVETNDAYRVFFSSDNPIYYPSGPQNNVPLDQIYGGGWSLCWVGQYSDPRTSVSEIQSSCNQKYVIMAGSISDPHQRNLPLGELALAGVPKVNQQLKVEPNNWLPEATFEYQWLRDGDPMSNANSISYVLQLDDYSKTISVRVTASKPGYFSVNETSNGALIGEGFLALTGVPSLSGNPVISDVLNASPGIWDAEVFLNYHWLRDGLPIPFATSSTYTLQASDYLKKISVAVTGSKEGYISETKTSDAVIPVKPKEKIASLRFTGSFKVGEKAYVGPSNRNGKFDYSYQWLRDGVEIAGATSRTYLIGSEDLGSSLSAKVCALYLKDVSHCVSQDAGSAVQLGLLKNVKASISGVAKVGRMLNSTPVIFDKQATVAYQWLRNSEPILDATRNTYFVDQLDKGSSISLRVTVSKPGYETEVKTSSSKLIN